MKKTWVFLLASLLLVFTLTACGSDKDSTGGSAAGSGVTDDAAGGDAGGGTGSDAGGGAGSDSAGGSGSDSAGGSGGLTSDTAGSTSDNITDPSANNSGDALLGGATGSGGAAGASFGQMLRNARVHDTDGDLMDLENAVTPGSTF